MSLSLFITGIGGFIGCRLAEVARERGHAVSGIDHSRAAVERAVRIGASAHLGSVSDGERLTALLRGVDVVVHTAAIVREFGHIDEFRRVNVDGTAEVARAGRAASVRTFVHVSSVMVYGFEYPDGVTEDGPRKGDNNPYCQTKIESEDCIRSFAEPGRFGVIVIRPGDVYGHGSVPWVDRPAALMKKGLFALPDRGRGLMNHVYVDNLVDGMLLAIEKAAWGETFNLTDGRRTTNLEYFTRLAEALGVPKPRLVPSALFHAAAAVNGALSRLHLADVEIGRDTVRYFQRPGTYSIERARTVLGYSPEIDLEEGLRRVRSGARV